MHALAKDDDRTGKLSTVRRSGCRSGHAQRSRGEPLEHGFDVVARERRPRPAEPRQREQDGVRGDEFATRALREARAGQSVFDDIDRALQFCRRRRLVAQHVFGQVTQAYWQRHGLAVVEFEQRGPCQQAQANRLRSHGGVAPRCSATRRTTRASMPWPRPVNVSSVALPPSARHCRTASSASAGGITRSWSPCRRCSATCGGATRGG
mmetsp:Transcript_5757/g.22352  ORF Transcript_5757/g.22352 Transcript_5757/m.22352 type:complete len:208 (-) Transcript_5757:2153-2776(-)